VDTATCTYCSGNAVYTREYEGVSFCSKCFRDALEEKVRKTIIHHQMLDYDDHVAVAVSGGKDSLTLLNILVRLEGRFPKSRLTAVSVDEGIDGYRDEALELARRACSQLGVEQVVVSYRELFGVTTDEIAGLRLGQTPCAYCGVFRRKAINKAAARATSAITIKRIQKVVGAEKLDTFDEFKRLFDIAFLETTKGEFMKSKYRMPEKNMLHVEWESCFAYERMKELVFGPSLDAAAKAPVHILPGPNPGQDGRA
jgi:predicted PP-loop superfamily ATPase